MIYKRDFQKADGRWTRLYGRSEIDPHLTIPTPSDQPISQLGSHMRWHPLRQEWVAYAGHRQNRTFLPPKEFNPLAPISNPAYPTELPQGNYDAAVFENMFPTLSKNAGEPQELTGINTMPAKGACEVVVFTKDPDTSLGRLPLDHLCLILDVWADRYQELGKRDDIAYVLPFENRGVEVGVTLHHPHGQIYAYPFVPPVPARQQQSEKEYYERHGRTLLGDFVARERSEGTRMLYNGSDASAFIPACARYPYEVWVAPNRSVPSLADLNAGEKRDLARALKTVLLKYDGLWQRPFPYLMVLYQAPTDGQAHPESHCHFQFFPPYRSSDRLKFLAGTELGAGIFANDAFPEAKAKELQAVEVDLA